MLVSELLDHVASGFELPPGVSGDIKERLVTRHRLQPFSEEYFRPGGRLFSYSRENSAASDAVGKARSASPPFCGKPLEPPGAQLRDVTLDRLAAFLSNPSKFFLAQRLNVTLPEEPAELEEREPFVLDALETHRLKHELVALRLRPGPPPADPAWMLASGRLPLGAVGRTEYRALAAGSDHFLELLQAHRPLTRPPHLDVDLAVGEFRVRGRILESTEAGPLYYRCAKTKAADILRAWVLHLAANCVEPRRKTTMVMEDGTRHYLQPDDPRALLLDLLKLWWLGLSAPLKFFPETALVFATARRKAGRDGPGANHDEALHKARTRWKGSEYGPPGECSNPHFALCFRRTDPLDHEFVGLAERIFEPILSHEEKEEP